jgi:hypothetical protein
MYGFALGIQLVSGLQRGCGIMKKMQYSEAESDEF